MTNFPSLAFQSFLGTEAILFGVFGFLYSIFGLYFSLLTPANPLPPPIVSRLRGVCRAIAILILFNAALTIYALFNLNPFPFGLELANWIMGIGFIVIILAIAVISLIWAFRYMR